MTKPKKDVLIKFKCTADFKRKAERMADLLDVNVSTMLRDITTRALAGYQNRINAGLPINTFKFKNEEPKVKDDEQ